MPYKKALLFANLNPPTNRVYTWKKEEEMPAGSGWLLRCTPFTSSSKPRNWGEKAVSLL